MVYDSNSRRGGPRDGDFESGRDYTASSSARDYAAAGEFDRGGGRSGDRGDDRPRGYGQGYQRYDQPRQDQRFGGDRDQGRYTGGREWHGSYGADGRHFEDAGRYRGADDDARGGRYPARDRGGYGRQQQGYDQDDRGFFQRAGDEVRSWFGDEDAEHRREADARYEERYDRSGGGRHDADYRQWRDTQVSQLDRDYHEYRQENRAKFENEFSTWRTARQGQRDQLGKVKEHAEVVGSDGAHVGTVDKTRDDRILLTKNDAGAGGRHHSIPSRWIATVDEKTVTLSKTAAEAKAAWEDEDRTAAMFNYGDGHRDGQRGRSDAPDTTGGGRDAQGRVLNRSFSGTY